MKRLTLAAALLLSLVMSQDTNPTPPPALEVGAIAPALRLNDERGQAVSLGGERETWTVLAFYPKALTPG